MRNTSWGAMLVGLGLVAVGCGGRGVDTEADAERDALVQRTQDLKGRVTVAQALTPELKAELERLVAEVRRWQEATGRDDIRVAGDSANPGRIARESKTGGGGSDCADCPGYTVEPDRVCFLESEGECPEDEGDDLTLGRACVYTCIWIGSRVEATPGVKR